MKKALCLTLTVLMTFVMLSSCNTGDPSDTTATADTTSGTTTATTEATDTTETADTFNDAFSEEEYKSYTSGVKVDLDGIKEIFNAQMSGEDNAVYVSFTPISYNAETKEYTQGEKVYYRFNGWVFDEGTDEKVYFEGNKTLSVITPQTTLSPVFKSSNRITRPEDYGYVRDTLAQLTFTETDEELSGVVNGDNAVWLTVSTWEDGERTQSMRYMVNYSTGKVDLAKTEGDATTYYTSNEPIPEEAIAYFILLAADMDHGVAAIHKSNVNVKLADSAVYKETAVNYDDIKAELHTLLFGENREISFPTVINNVTDFDTYTNSEAIYFPTGDTFYYMLTPDGSLYAVIGMRSCTPYITPSMTHMSHIHAPHVRRAEGTFNYEAVKALITGTATE